MINKKGFTLVELLGVVILIGILSLIAVPTVKEIVDDAKLKGLEEQKNNIIESATFDGMSIARAIVEYTTNPYIIKYAYKKSPAEVLEMLTSAINKAKEGGLDAAFMGWDWFRTPLEYTHWLVDGLVNKTHDFTCL